MRRISALVALFAVTLAGLGCQHVAGRCDCTHHAEDAQIAPINNPYPVVGGSAVAAPAAPAAMPK